MINDNTSQNQHEINNKIYTEKSLSANNCKQEQQYFFTIGILKLTKTIPPAAR